jgi:hypothetical protein
MEIKRGSRVSLNKRIRSYYFQGKNGINLRAGIEDTAVIPEDIGEVYFQMIQKSVALGHLVAGYAVEPDIKIPGRRDDKDLLEKGVKKMIPFLEKISKTMGKGEDSPVARLEKLLILEKEDKDRKTVTEKIEELLSGISGISTVEEDKKDKEEVKINLI